MRSCLARRIWRAAAHRTNAFPPASLLPSTGGALSTLYCAHPPAGHAQYRHASSRRSKASGKSEDHGSDAWLARLDRHLPQHLRENVVGASEPDARDQRSVARVMLDAQRPRHADDSVDLLFLLGMKQGRWNAVLWLVKHLVLTFAVPYAKSEPFASLLCGWSSQDPLDDITSDPAKVRQLVAAHQSASPSPSLYEILNDVQPGGRDQRGRLKHDVLGSIWQSLGLMSMACAGGAMRPEILEIIAYLHHMEIMPAAVYHQKHSADPTTIQQPPMLDLFSSKILTSLSDAAWRAHERLAHEDARAKAGQDSAPPSPIPGSAVRMNTAGLRPEVWVELILWSCLHGGWIVEGAAILYAMCSKSRSPRWRPLSWNALCYGANKIEDWDKLAYLFNTHKPSMLESRPQPPLKPVLGTISSEVVGAFVDALVCTVRTGVGERGAAPGTVLRYLSTLRAFLRRSKLGLQSGSWDAVVLRYFEAQETVVDQGENFETLITLFPGIGDELNANHQHTLPEYVLDGSAAVLGFFHRALQSRIKRGDVLGALRLFTCLQDLADKNKHQSVVDFLQRAQPLAIDNTETSFEMFTSNFSGIEYPAFSVQIPPTVLGPFLELICDAKAYDFGKWLLYSDEIDEPILPERHYGHAAVAPPLVRFATETSDTTLLAKLVKAQTGLPGDNKSPLSHHLLWSFFESQVSLMRWDAAVRVLQHGELSLHSQMNYLTIAHMIRSMLLQVRGAEAGKATSLVNLSRAKSLLGDVLRGRYDQEAATTRRTHEQSTLLLTMLAILSPAWAQYCMDIRSLGGLYTFGVTANAANLVLEGVVDAYGSVMGRKVLERFWPPHIRDAQRSGQRAAQHEAGELRMMQFRPDVLETEERKRTVVIIPGEPKRVIFYGGLKPNLMTIRIILRQAIKELTEGERDSVDASASEEERRLTSLGPWPNNGPADSAARPEMILWAVEALRSLRMTDEDIKTELERDLPEHELERVRERFPELFEVQRDPDDIVTDHSDEEAESFQKSSNIAPEPQ